MMIPHSNIFYVSQVSFSMTTTIQKYQQVPVTSFGTMPLFSQYKIQLFLRRHILFSKTWKNTKYVILIIQGANK